MKCENEKCRYEFFEREEHYICCPRCGEVVSENFPEEDSFFRGKAYIELCSYKKYLKKERYFAYIFAIIYLGLNLISFHILFRYVVHSLIEVPYPSLVFFRGPFVPALFVAYLSVYDISKYQIYKKIFGEIVWVCRLGWFKVIKWVVMLMFVVFISTKIMPNFYDRFPKVFAYCENSSLVKKKLVTSFSVTLWYVYVVMVISDINDIYKRKRCENMSMWC